MIKEEVEDPDTLIFKAVEDKDTIIAWVELNRPVEESMVKPDELLPAWPKGADAELCEEFFGKLSEQHKKVMGKKPHWCEYYLFRHTFASRAKYGAKLVLDLELLATSPAHQKRGAASLLIKHAFELADKSGHDLYLESSPNAVSLYRRHGFEEKGRIDVDVKGKPYFNIGMVRPPQW